MEFLVSFYSFSPSVLLSFSLPLKINFAFCQIACLVNCFPQRCLARSIWAPPAIWTRYIFGSDSSLLPHLHLSSLYLPLEESSLFPRSHVFIFLALFYGAYSNKGFLPTFGECNEALGGMHVWVLGGAQVWMDVGFSDEHHFIILLSLPLCIVFWECCAC